MTVSWLSGCAVDLPSSPASNPADANAPAAVTTPFRPTLLATSRTFLSLAADERERAAQQMDLGKTKSSAAELLPKLILPARCTPKSRKRDRATARFAG
jgi:hypothetical protein